MRKHSGPWGLSACWRPGFLPRKGDHIGARPPLAESFSSKSTQAAFIARPRARHGQAAATSGVRHRRRWLVSTTKLLHTGARRQREARERFVAEYGRSRQPSLVINTHHHGDQPAAIRCSRSWEPSNARRRRNRIRDGYGIKEPLDFDPAKGRGGKIWPRG